MKKYGKLVTNRAIAHQVWETATAIAIKSTRRVDKALAAIDKELAAEAARFAWQVVDRAETRLIHAIGIEVVEREKIRQRLELQPGETRQ
jgi:hypothetical protein